MGIGMSINPNAPTVLYRFFDDAGQLLYVGIARNPIQRLFQHNDDKPWAGDITTITLERFPTRIAAREAEIAAIMNEGAIHNDCVSAKYARRELSGLRRQT